MVAAVLEDFQRLLVVGGVVTGYAMFEPVDPDAARSADPAGLSRTEAASLLLK